jgi:hypothetical protein
MKGVISYFLLCCKGESEPEKEVNFMKDAEKLQEKQIDGLNFSFEEPEKEHLPEVDITDLKDVSIQQKLKSPKRPSIILSMDGSQHQVILYDNNVKPKKKKSKHKKRKKKSKK